MFLTLKGCEAKCVCDDGLYRSRETGHCVPIEEACERQCRTGTSLERITRSILQCYRLSSFYLEYTI